MPSSPGALLLFVARSALLTLIIILSSTSPATSCSFSSTSISGPSVTRHRTVLCCDIATPLHITLPSVSTSVGVPFFCVLSQDPFPPPPSVLV
ncbi:hypothetical protein EV426DRAFT_141034 [Tirmania nivea]|nr:hypothetical protein EV426DRAFT_141034 [Tirmania nivea]